MATYIYRCRIMETEKNYYDNESIYSHPLKLCGTWDDDTYSDYYVMENITRMRKIGKLSKKQKEMIMYNEIHSGKQRTLNDIIRTDEATVQA